jgi:hypothetical protein
MNEIKEDKVIVFLTPHRHGGVDYMKDDTATVTAQVADKLIKRNIAKLSTGSTTAKKEGAA